MKLVQMLVVCGALAVAPAAMAQTWELGAGVGGGFYTGHDITSPGGTASTKIKSNLSASAWLDNNRHGKVGGELRYDYQRGDLRLNQGSTEATFGAETHAIHYDVQWHFADSESRVRPFVVVGGGIKVYRGTGTEVIDQPLSKVALLTKAQDVTGLISVGAGFKMHLSPRVLLRLEVHDYITTFPKQVITPALGGSVGGWLQDIVPMIGLSFTN